MTKNTPHDSDVSFIKALAELLRENDLAEVQVKREYGENDSLNVRVSRYGAPAPAPAAAPAAPAPAALPAAAPSDEAADPASLPGAVTSPMVGTVYLQPEPGSPSFISLGAKVAEGDTLMQIAKDFVVDPEDLRKMNNLSEDDEVKPGQEILIPPVNL